MSNRNPYWTYSDAQAFLDAYTWEFIYDELIFVGGWFTLPDNPVDWWRTGWFYIGGLNPYGDDDPADIAHIWLQAEWTYTFTVSGESDYIDEGLSLKVFDEYGYLLISTHADSNTTLEDLIFDFKPSYTGWHNVLVSTDSYFPIDAELVIGAYTPDQADQADQAYIIFRDDYNWDNDIDTGDGYYITADNAQLYRAYMGAMGRLPDSGGFNWWANEIEQGRHDLFTMSDGFVNSSEFKGYADSNYDGYISNHEFITHMYEGVFGRAPDQGGYEYWIDQLNSGASDQGDVLVYMTQSNEYIDQTLETVADYLFV